MSSPQYSVVFSAPVSGTVTAGSVADVLIPDATSGLYVKATTANRGSRRSTGIALSAYAANGVTDIQQYGQVDSATAGLGAGSASWVRVSATGTLERASVSGTDDVVGYVEAGGVFHACFGFLTAAIVNGGAGSVAPTGTGFYHTTGGVMDSASVTVDLASAHVTGTLAIGNGGTGLVTLGAGMQTFWQTPSGANLASTLTSALPDTKGGTGLTALGAGVATFLGTPSGANLATALTTALPVSKGGTGLLTIATGMDTWWQTASGANLAAVLTSALPDTKGGTGLTALGSGVATALGTFSSANIKTACTDETGSGGALVFATGPTLSSPIIVGQVQGAAVAMGASAIDWSLGTVFTKTLSAGANTFTWSNQASGMSITVRVTGAASTLTWPTTKWAGGAAPTQTASGTDVYTFVHDGTSVYGSVVQAMA